MSIGPDPEQSAGLDLAAGFINARMRDDSVKMLELLRGATPNELAHALSYTASLYQGTMAVLASTTGRRTDKLHRDTMREWRRTVPDPRVQPRTSADLFRRPQL